VLVVAHSPVDGALVKKLSPRQPLKVVANYGVGVDHLKLQGKDLVRTFGMEDIHLILVGPHQN
jgi:hypothetical protein